MTMPVSMSDAILERLRAEIVSGRRAPGEPLRQDEIARSFGVSHVPIRETFLKLEAEGLVETRPRRGAAVTQLSADEIEELNEMRVALECSALRIAIPKIGPQELSAASSVLERIDREPHRWGELNTEFHSILYRAAERPRMFAAILSLQRNVERYLHREVEVTSNFAASQKEHAELLALIERGQIEEACSLLTVHILEPGRELAMELRNNGV